MRTLFATGHNDAAERARLQRNVEEKRRLLFEFGGHGYEVQASMALLALEQFERGQVAHLPTEPAA